MRCDGDVRAEDLASIQRGDARRVLLAEDDDALRGLIALSLREAGHEVIEAAGGDELLARVESFLVLVMTDRPIDVIVSDVMMPGFSGLDVLQMLREAGWLTPVLLITAFADPDTRRRARALEARVLDKPFALADLRAAVRDARPALRASCGS